MIDLVFQVLEYIYRGTPVNRQKEKEPMTMPNNSEHDLTPEIRSLTALWNQLYGDIMYRIREPQTGDPIYDVLCARIREYGYDKVREAVLRIGCSRYLMGRNARIPMSFAWFLNPVNFPKVLEGFYDDRRSRSGGGARVPAIWEGILRRDGDLDGMIIDKIIKKSAYAHEMDISMDF